MKINLCFAELHTPLFLGGRNFGLKLDNNKFTGLELVYDQTEKELWITNGGKTAIIPTSNVVSMTPAPILLEEVLPQAKAVSQSNLPPEKFKTNLSSQVSTPTSHVFAKPK